MGFEDTHRFQSCPSWPSTAAHLCEPQEHLSAPSGVLSPESQAAWKPTFRVAQGRGRGDTSLCPWQQVGMAQALHTALPGSPCLLRAVPQQELYLLGPQRLRATTDCRLGSQFLSHWRGRTSRDQEENGTRIALPRAWPHPGPHPTGPASLAVPTRPNALGSGSALSSCAWSLCCPDFLSSSAALLPEELLCPPRP